jgi:hypothetical protein
VSPSRDASTGDEFLCKFVFEEIKDEELGL